MLLDRFGRALNVGDEVRVAEIPADLIEGLPADDQTAIKLQLGRILSIESIRDDGTVELEFFEEVSEPDTIHSHSIWISPTALELVNDVP